MMFSYNESPAAPPPQREEHPEGIFCDICDKLIEIGEAAVEMYLGQIGRGGKSGRLMVTEYTADPYTPQTVHIWCAQEWISQNVWEDGTPSPEDDNPRLCDACGNKLDEKILGDD